MVKFLARARVPLGFVAGAVVLWLAEPTRGALAIGVALALVGEGIRIWAAGHLHKSSEVTASGPYRCVAHPLYLGSSIMGAGLAVASARASVAVLIAAYLVLTIGAAMRTEEAFLRKAFGDRYDRYRRGAADGARRFAWRQALANREHRAAIGLAIAILLLVFKATYNGLFWR